MFKGKKILVGLDFTLLDKTIIGYTGFLCRFLGAEKVYFINVQKRLDVPANLWSDFPELRLPPDEVLKEKMTEEVTAHFGEKGDADIDYIVAEGSPMKEIIHWANIKKIDLLIVGRKRELKGNGIVTGQLLRSFNGCMLFVPEETKMRLNDIMVHTDFSPASQKALEVAATIGHHNADVTIHCQHIYQLPLGYYFTEKGKEEVNRVIRAYHVQQYNQFIDNIELRSVHINPIFTLDDEGEPAQTALHIARKKNIDLIIAGATGKTMFDTLLLGSFTEKLVHLNLFIPMLVVKEYKTAGTPPPSAPNPI
ncbi:MAG TPA: universal stress protein [Chitinophagales bacterium]|nr:universal stress protein [Chitinophagales bacterium]